VKVVQEAVKSVPQQREPGLEVPGWGASSKPSVKNEPVVRKTSFSKTKEIQEIKETPAKTSVEEIASKTNNNNIANVKRAAEKFEANLSELNNKPEPGGLSFSSLRERSKSIGQKLQDQFEVDKERAGRGAGLPWGPAAVSANPPNRGYALQLSKSCDSVTAARLAARARSDSQGGQSRRVSEKMEVYNRTKEEIRQILSLAKVGSVGDRVALFTRGPSVLQPPAKPADKSEAIRREIEEARAAAQETVSDTEIEFQEPVESKVKPLKIRMKPRLVGEEESGGRAGLRINTGSGGGMASRERRPSTEDLPSVRTKIQTYISAAEDGGAGREGEEGGAARRQSTTAAPPTPQMTPRPILRKNSSLGEPARERSHSPKKKTPKLLGGEFLSPGQGIQIYAISATDMSATEDEAEHSKPARTIRKKSEPGPTLLQVPAKAATEARPGVIKSKSFASPGQFESSVEQSAGKKLQILSFFSSGAQKSVRMAEAGAGRRASTAADEIPTPEDDLVDIDAEFENLLNKTFEKEARQSSGGGSGPGREKVAAAGRAASQRRARGGSASQRPSAVQQTPARSRSSSAETMARPGKTASWDPVSALPRTAHSPSPTMSEYDTCDPWDDY